MYFYVITENFGFYIPVNTLNNTSCVAPAADVPEEIIFNIRSVYGEDVKIIWCYGYNEHVDATWEVAKTALDGLNGNGTIYYCRLPYSCLSKADGGDGIHPDETLAQGMADALTAFITDNIYTV